MSNEDSKHPLGCAPDENAAAEEQEKSSALPTDKGDREQADAVARQLEELIDAANRSLQELGSAMAAAEQKTAEAEQDIQQMAQKKLDMEKALVEYKERRLHELDEELDGERKKIAERLARSRDEAQAQLEQLISSERNKRLEMLRSELDQKRSEDEAVRAKLWDEAQAERQALEERLRGLERALAAREAELEARAEELEKRSTSLSLQEKLHKARDEQLKIQLDLIPDRVREYFGTENSEMNAELAELKRLLADQQRRFAEQEQELERYRRLKAQFQENPDILLKRYDELQENCKQLREELGKRCSQEAYEELRAENTRLQQKSDRSKAQCVELSEKLSALEHCGEENDLLLLRIRRLEAKEQEQRSLVQEYENRTREYQEKLKRLSATEAITQDRDARIAELQKGVITSIPDQQGREQPESEMAWLEGIQKGCENFGIVFPKRILYAFHTALKIADWSSIVVLAGVSGTGKSELPRLYSLFGGINFLNVPVQPNWDSQESMLGYFNSIDNRFDAQPLLRFLIQCASGTSSDAVSLGKYMNIVLLDEMNLAHVELYFADFLSKLEQRRGLTTADIPTIEVKLGAGMEPYHLRLGRNVLWAGTMNQDETTKSLSDKVLDRGVVINFPRPQKLRSREGMDKLKQYKNETLLEYKTWNKWCRRYMYKVIDTNGNGQSRGEPWFSDDEKKELDEYKGFAEALNSELSKAGRAIGHRVWQSIEYYILNYPLVIAAQQSSDRSVDSVTSAMKTAFEDQVVQKIMPKLRGIETRGEGGRVLDNIKSLLENIGLTNLLEDFDNACERGYGQFVWNSAEYLTKDDD